MADWTKEREAEVLVAATNARALTGSVDGCGAQGCDTAWFQFDDLPPSWRELIERDIPDALAELARLRAELEQVRAERDEAEVGRG